MTRLDDAPTEEVQGATECDGPRALILPPREVPLGGVRAMQVHRTLPQRDLPMVGAWCFLDRFGPQVARMRVDPHPHIGLQTVTWPLVGEVRHRDSLGSDVTVRRGALNLMTAGRGISHSEYSVGEGDVPLDALQLWVALPESSRHGDAGFERHEHLPEAGLPASDGPDASATVVMGTFAGSSSPATTHTPIVGAEVRIPGGSRARLPLIRDWEYAIVQVEGDIQATTATNETTPVPPGGLLYLGIGRESIAVTAEQDATLFLLGGEPFEDEIVMWWNFVGRAHDEIVEAREDWEAGSVRFGHVVTHADERIPAPPLPHVRLTPRRRRV